MPQVEYLQKELPLCREAAKLSQANAFKYQRVLEISLEGFMKTTPG